MINIEYTTDLISQHHTNLISLTNVFLDNNDILNKFDSDKTFDISEDDCRNQIEKYIAGVLKKSQSNINFIWTNLETE
jgi:hypothetical protein